VTTGVSRTEAARRAGVTAQTLRRWEHEGLVPQARDGAWTPAAIAQARVVAVVLAGELLPLASPIMARVHQRFLTHFVEQDVVGHMEADLDGSLDLGRMRVTIAFADLAGYTRLTEEAGEEEAVDAVERFIEDVEVTLPDDARVVKTIGDEVMVVGSDPSGLVDWAVALQRMVADRRPLPRIGIHYGLTLYRDGDYYGREVNLAARVAARAAGGEVVVTSAVVQAAEPHLEFERIGEVRLKGFNDPTELFVAGAAEHDG
jgi:adenylate cyclase